MLTMTNLPLQAASATTLPPDAASCWKLQSLGGARVHRWAPDAALTPAIPSSVSTIAVPAATASAPVGALPLYGLRTGSDQSWRPVARLTAITWSQFVESWPYAMS